MASGRTLPDVLAMAIPEYAGWTRFLAEHPPGDERTHILLATLCALLSGTPKGQKPKTALDFLPWLNRASPESDAKKAKEAKQAAENREQVIAMRQRLREGLKAESVS